MEEFCNFCGHRYAVLDQCLVEDEVKNCSINRELSAIELISLGNPLTTSSSLVFSYTIESNIDLKSLIKFIPS